MLSKIIKMFGVEDRLEKLQEVIEARLQKILLQIQKEVAKGVARIFLVIFLFLLFLIALMFFSVGLSIYLNTFFDHQYPGYLIVGGLYLLIFVVIVFLNRNRWLARKINDIIDREVVNSNSHEEENQEQFDG